MEHANLEGLDERLQRLAEQIGYLVIEDRTAPAAVVTLDRMDWEELEGERAQAAAEWARQVAEAAVRASNTPRRFRLRVYAPSGARQIGSWTFTTHPSVEAQAPGPGGVKLLDLDDASPLSVQELLRTALNEARIQSREAMESTIATFKAQIDAAVQLQSLSLTWYQSFMDELRGELRERAGQLAKVHEMNNELQATILNLHVDNLEARKQALDEQIARQAEPQTTEDKVAHEGLDILKQWLTPADVHPDVAAATQRPDLRPLLNDPRFGRLLRSVTAEQLTDLLNSMENS